MAWVRGPISVATGRDQATPEAVCRSHTLPVVSTWGFVALLPRLEPALEPRRRRKLRFRERAIGIASSFRNSPFHLRRLCRPPPIFDECWVAAPGLPNHGDAMPCLAGGDPETLRRNLGTPASPGQNSVGLKSPARAYVTMHRRS